MSSINVWYATRATGIGALVLLTVTMFLGILTAGRAKSSLPAFVRADVHRRISILTIVFLAIHILTSVLDTYVHISWTAIVVPFTSSYHTFWLALGTVGVDLLLAVAISSALRQYITARTWRGLHWLAYLSWPVAIAHSLGMGTDGNLDWVLAVVAVCIACIVGMTTWRVLGVARARASFPATITSPRRSIRSDRSTEAAGNGVWS